MTRMLRPMWLQPLFVLVMLCLAGCALGVSDWKSPEPTFKLIYGYVLPALPFVLLAVLSFGWPQQLGPLCGAAIGAAIAVGVPWALLKYELAHYSGGGANIGLGLLLLAMPIYLPILMLAGFGIAALIRGCSHHTRHLTA